MTDKTNHIYEDTFQVGVKYTYDRKHNKVYDIDSAVKEFNMLIKKGVGKFIGKPIKNPKGKQWIKNQLVLKKKGIK